MTDTKKCPACAEEVKVEAVVCRYCGYDFKLGKGASEAAETKKQADDIKSKGVGCLVLLGLIGALYMCTLPSDEEKAAQATTTAQDKQQGLHCLSKWDGSNRSLVDQVKANLRDPNSFEHDATRIAPADKDGLHTVMMTYRARNGFGGLNAGTARAKVEHESCNAIDVVVDDAD